MNKADLIPPALYRWLKSKQAPPKHIDWNGRRIEHRGTPADLGVVNQVFYGRDYDFSRLARSADIARFYENSTCPLIIDAGANIGASTVYFAQTYPKASVTAIEPHAGNYGLLKRNTDGLNVNCMEGALASRQGTIRLFDPGEGEWGFRTGGEGPGLGEVPAYTVADLMRGEPFVLKIDIEGGEADIFDNDVFNRFPVVVIELHDWLLPRGRTSQGFLRWHASQDRDLVPLGENFVSLCNRLL